MHIMILAPCVTSPHPANGSQGSIAAGSVRARFRTCAAAKRVLGDGLPAAVMLGGCVTTGYVRILRHTYVLRSGRLGGQDEVRLDSETRCDARRNAEARAMRTQPRRRDETGVHRYRMHCAVLCPHTRIYRLRDRVRRQPESSRLCEREAAAVEVCKDVRPPHAPLVSLPVPAQCSKRCVSAVYKECVDSFS
ncbi:hypothetical protein OH76DRAFT_103402 [Lentinus brumalis]|uniref:Uncharacterized protein n=1 Tax=Lentinus brumalis TaxID=2498619 RepID=A0A371CQ32_9APHY|nr:hypothetical protein OH76DRAFT_103402 [Polyporus brumalis]